MPPHYLLARLRLLPAIQDINLSRKLKRTHLHAQDLTTRNLSTQVR